MFCVFDEASKGNRWRPMICGSTAEEVIKLVQRPRSLLHSVEPFRVSEESISLPERDALAL
jgi:hypothetical protein